VFDIDVSNRPQLTTSTTSNNNNNNNSDDDDNPATNNAYLESTPPSTPVGLGTAYDTPPLNNGSQNVFEDQFLSVVVDICCVLCIDGSYPGVEYDDDDDDDDDDDVTTKRFVWTLLTNAD
jgi:hypothetical protein